MWADFITQLDLDEHEVVPFVLTEDGEVLDGILLDRNDDNSYFFIEDGILDLHDDYVADWDRRDAFVQKYASEFTARGVPVTHMKRKKERDDNKILQRVHHDHESLVYDQNLSNSPYGKASDNILFTLWADELIPGKRILDLGCGTGRRGSQALLRTRAQYTGIDISFGMIQKARKKYIAAGIHRTANFCAGDVEKSLVKPQSVDTVLVTGVLHHATEPINIILRGKEALVPGGVFLSYENNASSMRLLFDLLQKINPVWHEEAGTYHIISAEQVRDWFAQAGGYEVPEVTYHVYLPPQAYNLFGDKQGLNLMKGSDSLGRSLPFWKRNAGIIIIKARKQ